MSPALRTSLLAAAGGLVVFALALAGGFVVGRDPRPDTIAIRLEPPEPATEEFHRGVVTGFDGVSLELATAGGAVRFDLLAGVPVEDLAPLDDAAVIEDGTQVLIGGERTNNGYVLTGVVLLETTQ